MVLIRMVQVRLDQSVTVVDFYPKMGKSARGANQSSSHLHNELNNLQLLSGPPTKPKQPASLNLPEALIHKTNTAILSDPRFTWTSNWELQTVLKLEAEPWRMENFQMSL